MLQPKTPLITTTRHIGANDTNNDREVKRKRPLYSCYLLMIIIYTTLSEHRCWLDSILDLSLSISRCVTLLFGSNWRSCNDQCVKWKSRMMWNCEVRIKHQHDQQFTSEVIVSGTSCDESLRRDIFSVFHFQSNT